MLFNSIEFLFFFPVVTLIYFLLPHQWRWLHLLLASCVFYMAFIPKYIIILAFTIVVDYIAGIKIEASKGHQRRLFLIISILANVGILSLFKYYNFFISNINELFYHLPNAGKWSLPFFYVILPVGLSFHTFQAMSYTIEVYRGNQPAEKHFGIYALYVMFYPQLVAGPIERPQNMIHQFREKHYLNIDSIAKGLRLMLWGFFMKIVIADRLAIYVNAVYDHPVNHNGTTLLVATIFFAVQIYCDFAGYSYIALGCANAIGFELMTNFERPYFSATIEEFWRRWHISLSTWFRDYLYIPLGGNRVAMPRWFFNLLLVFLISGLWHGANWTFIAWGGLNGIYLITAILTKKWKTGVANALGLTRIPFIYKAIQVITTFLLVSLAWVFFRANNIADAVLIIKKIISDRGSVFQGHDTTTFSYSLLAIFLLLIIEIKKEYFQGKYLFFTNSNTVIRYSSYTIAVISILLLGVCDGGQFIYFQF
jgi:alginate O-acetyltransferase complex protein AlgI